MSLWLWFSQKSLFLKYTSTAKTLKAEAQRMKPVPSHLGGLQKKPKPLFIYLFYFQLNKLLTFSSRVLIFLAWLLNSGNTRLLIPGEVPCTASLKCGLELQKPKWGPPFSAKTRKFLMVSYIPLLDTNTLLPPPKTMQITQINCLGLVANIPNTSEEMWPLWVPNFTLKGHVQMWAINVLALKLVFYPCPEYPALRKLYYICIGLAFLDLQFKPDAWGIRGYGNGGGRLYVGKTYI